VAYRVLLARDVPKQLDRIPARDFARIRDAIKALGAEPRPDGCVKLEDTIFRIRVGAYRVIYSVLDEDKTVLVLKAVRRSEATYR
jgi:mRNA interferase RelE/StbE